MSKDLGISGTWLTVNRRCNFRCIWCYAKGTEYSAEDDMSFSKAKKISQLSASVGVDEIIYIGGEPTLWQHLWEVDKFIHELGLVSSIVTNGYLIGFDDYAQKLSDSGIDFINISLKAGSEKQHEKLTQVSSRTFDVVERGIRNASVMDKGVNISIVVSSLVIDNIDDIVSVACRNGVRDVFLQICTPDFSEGEASLGYMLNPSELAHKLEEKYPRMNELTEGKLVIEGTIPICAWNPNFLKKLQDSKQLSLGCQVRGRSGIVFDPEGSVIMCNHLYDYPLGKLGIDFEDEISFEKFWTGSKLDDIYKEMCSYPTMECSECDDFTICGGGCPLQWFVFNPIEVISKERR